jgi:hypothetical protein
LPLRFEFGAKLSILVLGIDLVFQFLFDFCGPTSKPKRAMLMTTDQVFLRHRRVRAA